MRHAKLTAFRLTEADRAYLDTLEDKLGFSKTDVLRLALRRLADVEGIELLKKSDPLRLPPTGAPLKSTHRRLRAGDLQYLNVEDKRRKPLPAYRGVQPTYTLPLAGLVMVT